MTCGWMIFGGRGRHPPHGVCTLGRACHDMPLRVVHILYIVSVTTFAGRGWGIAETYITLLA